MHRIQLIQKKKRKEGGRCIRLVVDLSFRCDEYDYSSLNRGVKFKYILFF